MKRILFPVIVSLLSASSVNATTVSSTFSTDAEGWTAQGDFTNSIHWLAGGGNPGGNISLTDLGAGATMFFVAPAKFLGNQSSTLGGTLSFDLKQSYSGSPNQYNDSDVILQGNGLSIVFNLANNPARDLWTPYTIPLLSTGWTLNSLNGGAVSASQFLSVLSNLTALKIRAEYQTGVDTDYLDNVSLAAVPLPASYFMFMTGVCCFPRLFGGKRRSDDTTR